MSSIIKVNGVYILGGEEVKITHLFERTKNKKTIVLMTPVDEVDMDDVPPPRKNLHQNRYGIAVTTDGKKRLYLKLLSPAFYKKSQKWHIALSPYAKGLFIPSNFDDEQHIITQPIMKDSILRWKLLPNYVDRNVKKITDFIKAIEEAEDKSIVSLFNRMDIHKENFMVDGSRKKLYLVDFNPWMHVNKIELWDGVIKEIK